MIYCNVTAMHLVPTLYVDRNNAKLLRGIENVVSIGIARLPHIFARNIDWHGKHRTALNVCIEFNRTVLSGRKRIECQLISRTLFESYTTTKDYTTITCITNLAVFHRNISRYRNHFISIQTKIIEVSHVQAY